MMSDSVSTEHLSRRESKADPKMIQDMKAQEEARETAKRLKDNMKLLMYGDVRNEIDASSFRKLMNPANPENYLVDLTFNLINTAIEEAQAAKTAQNAKIKSGSHSARSRQSAEVVASPRKAPVANAHGCTPRLGINFSKTFSLHTTKEHV